MRVSDIADGRDVWCELPNDDASAGVGSREAREAFIARYGDVEVVHKYGGYYGVPEFAEGRKKWIEKKIKICDQWGCE